MISYSLNKNISGEKILQDIQRLVSKYQEPKDSLVLTIRVEKISRDDNSLIPKLEYKEEPDCPT